MNIRLASILSTIGHPLLTIPTFVIAVLFASEDFYKASVISLLVLGLVIIPLSLKMYRGSQNGTYSNFDISDKNERQSWYLIPLLLLSIFVVIVFYTNQSHVIKWISLCFFLILLLSSFVNRYIKSSLHVSLNIFLTFLIVPISVSFATFFLIFVLFVSWSRVVLKRHTLKEVIYGSIIGVLIGLLSYAPPFGFV
jgi:membrane-associated phospholipid phosphatase